MNAAPTHADVWVINQDQALLFRQRDQQWAEEQSLPYSEFCGSAIALSSFSLPDTVVYLNVFQYRNTAQMLAGQHWAGVAEAPLRVIEAPANLFHLQALTELRSMGKSARTIWSEKPAQFNRGIQMVLLNPEELKHLKNFTNSNKSGGSQFRNSLQLYLNLWAKPSGHYQAIRGVAAACVLGTFLVMSWHANTQQSKHEKANLQQFKNALTALPVDLKAAPYTDWFEQIRKFGHSERANLVSLKMSWNEQGEMLTTADLERDRKKVPKACTLHNPRKAQCSTGAIGQ